MKRTDYVKAVAKESGFTQKDVKAFFDAAQTVAYREAMNEGGVTIFDGLTLETKMTSAREGRNPATGEPISIAAKRLPHAKFGKAFKDAVAL